MAGNKPSAEQHWAANTDVFQIQSNNHAGPVSNIPLEIVSPENESDYENAVEREGDATDLSNQNDGKQEYRGAHRLIERTLSNQIMTTEKSVASSVSRGDAVQAPRERTLKEKLNPFKKKNIPPIPAERVVTREYQAGFFSALYFQN
jgi:hypothetical protein